MEHQLLRDTPLDEGLNREELSFLSQYFGRQMMAPGTTLFAPGEDADAFYVLLDGKVELKRHDASGDETVEILEGGRAFGELALLGGRKRAARASVIVRASGSCPSSSARIR